jgi:hypothetical protein
MKRLLLLLLVATAVSAQEAIPWGQEFRVNTTVAGGQSDASAVGLSDGRFVVCWMSTYQDWNQNGTFAQRYAADGKPQGVEFRVISEADGYQSSLCTTGLPSGGFVVCFQLWPDEGPDIFAKCYGADGKPTGNKFRVNNVTKDNQYSPSIAGLANGDFLVCWVSPQSPSVGSVFARRYGADGKPLGNEFCIKNNPGLFFNDPSVAGLSNGGFVVCGRAIPENSISEIRARLFGADGKPVGDEFRVNSNSEFNQREPHVTGLSDGGFVVCWDTIEEDYHSTGCWARCYGAGGQPVGGEFRVGTHSEYYERQLHIAGLSNGGFIACWVFENQVSSSEIYAQRFQADGQPVGSEFRVNSFRGHYHEWPCTTSLSGGGFVVCWQSDQDGIGGDIYGKRFPPEPLRHELKPFLLKQPTYDATVQTTKPVLQWQAASSQSIIYSEELVYTVFYDTLSNLSTAQQIATISDTTVTLPTLKKGKTWFWKVLAKTCYNDSLWSSVGAFFISNTASRVASTTSEPGDYAVLSNYPNPFNPSTTIRFDLPTEGHVTLNIYDLTGRLVRVLAAGNEACGLHSVKWDGMNEAGALVAAGLYFCRLEYDNSSGEKQVLVQKMSLLK